MMIKRLTFKHVIIISLFTIFIFSYIRQGIMINRIQEDIITSQEQLNQIKRKNENLQAELNKAGSDEYIEKLARERLGMIKDGEQVINSKKQD